jgi:DNA-binding transcriptional regulator YiaG
MPTGPEYEHMVDVARIRADHGLTIKEITTLLGVPTSTYTQWEYGKAQPSGAALSLLLIMAMRPDVVYEVLEPLEQKNRSSRKKGNQK